MWRIVEHKYKPEVYRSGHTHQLNKLTEKSVEQDDMNAEQDGDLLLGVCVCAYVQSGLSTAGLRHPVCPAAGTWTHNAKF